METIPTKRMNCEYCGLVNAERGYDEDLKDDIWICPMCEEKLAVVK